VVVRFVVSDDDNALSQDEVMNFLSTGSAASSASLIQRILQGFMPADSLQVLLHAMREGTLSVVGSAAMDTQPPSPPATPQKLVVTDPDESQSIMITGAGEVCTICQESVEPDSEKSRSTPLVQTACGHTFCKSCLQQWFDTGHNTCCVCNATVQSVVQINNPATTPAVTSSTATPPPRQCGQKRGQKRTIAQMCNTSCPPRQMTQPAQSAPMSAAE
jgi:hypothetical protein